MTCHFFHHPGRGTICVRKVPINSCILGVGRYISDRKSSMNSKFLYMKYMKYLYSTVKYSTLLVQYLR